MLIEPADLKRELILLPDVRRVAFAASCCERMLPNYEAFARDVGWGDVALFRNALDAVWAVAAHHDIHISSIRGLRAACEGAIPDTELFSSPYTSPALDVGTALIEALECCVDLSAEHAVTVASIAYDTIDMFIQARDDLQPDTPDFEERIRRDPLMVGELEHQRADLSTLATSRATDAAVSLQLRRLWEGKSNIGIHRAGS